MAHHQVTIDSSSREINDFRAWVIEHGKHEHYTTDKSDGSNENDESDVSKDKDEEYDGVIRTDTMELRSQRKSPLLRLPGELRNKIYGYLDPNKTKTHTVYASEYKALSQTSRQLRTEVMSYAINDQSIFFIDYADLGNFCHGFKCMKKNDNSDVIVGVYGRDHWLREIINVQSILIHLEPRQKGGVRYFAIKNLCCMDYMDRAGLFGTSIYCKPECVFGFLVDALHVGIVRRNGLNEDAWCYVDRGGR